MIKDLQAGDPALVGPYRLLGRLGAGGMGQVFLGKSPGGRLVAIKLIRPELAEERGFRTRFSGEISAARNVSGVYTAGVVDADADAENPWLATVYVPGPSLADAVEETGPLPVASVFSLAGGLAEALVAIHRAGLIHRDLKPSNVLLATDGPRVIDFGISRVLERSMMTTTGMVLGSPGFMSPEQARGEQVGAPSDVFSLGAVLAYAATGEGPFGRGPTPALLYRVVNETPDLAGVPGELRSLIERCLAKNPADRPTPPVLLELLSDDVGVLTGDWLPEAVTGTIARYSPTLQTPLPGTASAADAARPSGERQPAAATPAPAGSPVETSLADIPAAALAAAAAPALAAAAAAAPGLAANASANGLAGTAPTVGVAFGSPTRPGAGTPGALTSPPSPLDSGAATVLQQQPPSGIQPPPPPPSPEPGPVRRFRWPIVAVLAAVIVAVVAFVVTANASGGSKKGVSPTPTASTVQTATHAAASATATATPTAKHSSAAPGKTASAAQTAAQPVQSSAAPTTQAPTTQAPTTQAPTTQAPTTQAPTTQAPTTQAPTTQAPTTQAPTTQAPTTQAPTTQAATTQAPAQTATAAATP